MVYIREITFVINLIINVNKIIKEVHIALNKMIFFFDLIIAHMQKEVNKIDNISKQVILLMLLYLLYFFVDFL